MHNFTYISPFFLEIGGRAIMFDGGAICIEILFFDNEVIAEHNLFVLLY